MGMLDANDLKLIGEEMGRVIDDNLMPRIEELIDEKLTPLKTDIVGIKASMVTKEYLDEKLWKLKGDLIAQDRKLEHKTDTLIDTLAAHGTLATPDLERLEQARVFPQSP